jgi:intracellular sulfur oxidation DsrE/DsrF family protein
MLRITHSPSRRSFLGRLAAFTSFAIAGDVLVPSEVLAEGEWDTRWIERVRKAKHRALFDAPSPDVVLDLAARYVENVQRVYGKSTGGICPVLNIRTRASRMGLNDAMWAKYPIGEDAKVNDPETNAPSRRNLDMRVSDEKAAQGYGSFERLQQQGAIVLVCDFALGHLSTRLAAKTGSTGDAVHAELKRNLIPGAVLVPSGIYGAAQAQNAGCAFIPA